MGPYMVKYCFDDPTAHTIEILEKAAKGSVSDLIQVVKLIKEFSGSIS